ncbi:MAG: cobalamin B12-binding domain-containing protein [Planctomycetota bacterium]|jgi:trimethylamine corrinoid protein
MSEVFVSCRKAIIEGDRVGAEALARDLLKGGADPLKIIEEGFVPGLREMGKLWEEGEVFLPELVVAADAMKAATAVLKPAIEEKGGRHESKGRVVIGTIEGDIHDIGKTLVATLLSASGYETRDLGVDVPVERFVDEAVDFSAHFICVSTLLTTTMTGQRRIIEALKVRSMRDDIRVLVGGAPCSQKWAEEIGADGYAADAVSAVALADSLGSSR